MAPNLLGIFWIWVGGFVTVYGLSRTREFLIIILIIILIPSRPHPLKVRFQTSRLVEFDRTNPTNIDTISKKIKIRIKIRITNNHLRPVAMNGCVDFLQRLNGGRCPPAKRLRWDTPLRVGCNLPTLTHHPKFTYAAPLKATTMIQPTLSDCAPGMHTKNSLSRRARWAGGEPIASVLMAKTLANPELVSLAAGFVDHQTLPVEPARQALEALWSDPECTRAALQYGTTVGHPPLREAVLDRMLKADGRTAAELNLSPARVVITAGSNQLLYLVVNTLLDPGDIVICGAPSYFVFLGMLTSLGARAVGVEIDQHGLIPRAAEDQLRRFEAAGQLDRVKAIYVTSYYDNPSGVSVPAGRRAELVEIARRWSKTTNIRVIEDIAYRELRYYGEDIPSIRAFDSEGDTVIVAGTFSKSFSPGIRVGWGILPQDLVAPVLSQKGHIDFGSPNFNQHLMATVLRTEIFDTHVTVLQDGYRKKIDATLDAAERFLGPIDGVEWIRPTGGLYVWLSLPEQIDTGLSGPLFDVAVQEGVLYVPGQYCYATEGQPAPRNMIRLSFGIQSCESIYRGMESLGRAIRRVI